MLFKLANNFACTQTQDFHVCVFRFELNSDMTNEYYFCPYNFFDYKSFLVLKTESNTKYSKGEPVNLNSLLLFLCGKF